MTHRYEVLDDYLASFESWLGWRRGPGRRSRAALADGIGENLRTTTIEADLVPMSRDITKRNGRDSNPRAL